MYIVAGGPTMIPADGRIQAICDFRQRNGNTNQLVLGEKPDDTFFIENPCVL